MNPLDNKLAIITGGSGGLGKAIAEKCIAAGAQVVITDIDDERGQQVAEALGCRFFRQDVSAEADWLALKAYLEPLGPPHILVNNAAVLRADNIEQETLANFQSVMAINCQSVFLAIHHLLPVMTEQGGSIINVSSSSAFMGYPHFCAYTASKSAVRSLTMSTAVHAKQQGYPIRCNSVHPDGMLTPMVMDIPGNPPQLTPEKGAHAASFACQPDAVADVVVFLASDASRHVNGAALSVDNTATIYPPHI